MTLDEWLFKNKKKYTKTAFAKLLGLHPGYFSQVIVGNATPSVRLAMRIDELTNGEVKWNELILQCIIHQEAKDNI